MPNIHPGRSVGNTTRQMQAAPQGAVFIWCNNVLDYPRRLARDLGRADLKIVPLDWLAFESWRGEKLTGLVLDHAAELSVRKADSHKGAMGQVVELVGEGV